MKKLFLCLAVLLSVCSFAQDTNYVHRFAYRSKIKAGFNLFTQQLDLYSTSAPQLDSHSVFVPNVNSTFGISVGLRWLSFGYSFKIPNNYYSESKFGKSKYHNFSIDSYHNWWGAAAYLRSYNSFFMPDKFFSTAVKRPDVSFVNAGVNLFYFGNSDKFSFRAAFSQDRKQIRSAGGFILGSEFSIKRIKGDRSLIIPSTDTEKNFGKYKGTRLVSFGLIQLRPGYAYNFSFEGGKYYICPMLLVGGGASAYRYISDIESNVTAALHADGEFRISAGYDTDRFFLNGKFELNWNYNFMSKTVILSHRSYDVSLTCGFRFDRKKTAR